MAIVVEIIAILVVNAEADAEVIDPPMVVATEKTAPEAAEEPEEPENERIEAALLARSHVIEDCAVTHYDCCVQCCGKDDGITASGVRATPGVTVAVDPTVIPLGADVLVDYAASWYRLARETDEAMELLTPALPVSGRHLKLTLKSLPRDPDRAYVQINTSWMDRRPDAANEGTPPAADSYSLNIRTNIHS